MYGIDEDHRAVSPALDVLEAILKVLPQMHQVGVEVG